jgi:hypothetical protein
LKKSRVSQTDPLPLFPERLGKKALARISHQDIGIRGVRAGFGKSQAMGDKEAVRRG